MPNAGTLDTLRIEIEANSQKASDGVGKLVGSLRHLAKATGTVLPSLRAVNRELKTLASLKGISIPGVGSSITGSAEKAMDKSVKGFKAVGSVLKEYRQVAKTGQFASWMYGPNPLPKISNNVGPSGMLSEEESRRLNPQWYRDPAESQLLAQRHLRDVATRNSPTTAIAEEASRATQATVAMNNAINGTAAAATAAAPAIQQAAAGTRDAGEESEVAEKRVSKLNKALSRISRIASTMVIRTALKAVMKAFSESWEAAYAFSNRMGGSFAKAVDQARTSLADTATTIIQTVAPVFQAMVPVINVIAGAIQFLCQQIQALLSMIGLSSDLFGANTQAINKNIGASNKNAKSRKNLLASWDELNVIQSSGGGGSGSGYKPGSMKDFVQSELSDITSVLVGEALLAVGLIMAFTGHVGLGIALAALGATAIVKPIATKWGKMSENVKRELTNITIVAGASMLALGTILLLSGAGTGLGIAMLIAGGLNLATAVALNWGNIVAMVKLEFAAIEHIVVSTWENIKVSISNAWEAVTSWFDENIVQNVTAAWFSVTDFFTTLFGSTEVVGSIAYYAYNAWEWVKEVWTENIVEPVSAVWNGIVDWFKVLFGGADVDGSLANYALSGWEWVKWVWTQNILAPLSTEWNRVKDFFVEMWGDSETGICGEFSAAWAEISKLWGNIIANIQMAWGQVGTWFHDHVTAPIANFFIDCVNGIIDGVNWIIGKLNTINITIPAVSLPLVGQLWGETKVGIQGIAELEHMARVAYIGQNANGAYGIPSGDLFIANERGAELVGSMNGKTTVANQGQIIEGIQRGVRDANAEQNDLLRRQNDLLMNLLEKSGTVKVEPSAAWGRFNQRSAEMWGKTTGR